MLAKLRSMAAQPGFGLLLVGVALLAFAWPWADREADASALFAYYFSAWAALILAAFLISRSVGDAAAAEDDHV